MSGVTAQHGRFGMKMDGKAVLITGSTHAGGVTPISTVEQGGKRSCISFMDHDVADMTGLFFNGMNETQAHPQSYD
jgi:hypothetical protein